MDREEELYYRYFRSVFKDNQEAIREYNKTLINFPSGRTVAEEEDLIINKFGGKKLDLDYFYGHLDDFIFECGDRDFLKSSSICEIIETATEEIIPEEYFYGLYLIELEKDERYTKPYENQLLVYIASCDKVNVYIASFLSNHTLRTNEYEEKFSSALRYCVNGVISYENEIPEELLFRVKLRIIKDRQKKVLAYDKKLIETKGNNALPGRTIKEEEDIIFNKFGGKKLDADYSYENLKDFFFVGGTCKYLKFFSIPEIIALVTGEIIPEEYFYGLYLLPVEKDERYPFSCQKQMIVYIASRDGENVYLASFLNNRRFRFREFEKMLSSQLYYAEDGIVVFEDELP